MDLVVFLFATLVCSLDAIYLLTFLIAFFWIHLGPAIKCSDGVAIIVAWQQQWYQTRWSSGVCMFSLHLFGFPYDLKTLWKSVWMAIFLYGRLSEKKEWDWFTILLIFTYFFLSFLKKTTQCLGVLFWVKNKRSTQWVRAHVTSWTGYSLSP